MKKIICTILCLTLMLAVIPFTFASAEKRGVDFKITPDKTEVSAGDTVTFTVSVGQVSNLQSINFLLKVPSGLTYVANSGKVADGLVATLGCAVAGYTESTKAFIVYGGGSYSSNADTTLMTFKCTVDANATGSYSIDHDAETDFGDSNFEAMAYNFVSTPVTVVKKLNGVTMNATSASIGTGANKQLSVTLNPADLDGAKIVWSSTNSDVASVDQNGLVTAKKPGSATIKATVTYNGTQKVANCNVTVTCNHINGYSTITAKTSSCTEKGNNEYYKCNDCGAFFTDTAMKNATTAAAQLLPLANHTPIVMKDAAGHWTECEACHNTLVAKVAHTFKYVVDVPATEGADGQKHEECEVCRFARDPEVICAHLKTETVGAKAATCGADGYTGDLVCSDCGEVLAAGKAITERPAHEYANGKCKNCGAADPNAKDDPVDTGDATIIAVATVVVAGLGVVLFKKKKEHAAN